jgi:hemerythrin
VDQIKALTPLAFTEFLKNWVLTHIAVSDRQYFEYFKKIAARKENGKLSITKADVVSR